MKFDGKIIRNRQNAAAGGLRFAPLFAVLLAAAVLGAGCASAPENAGISAPGSLSGSAGMAGGTTGMAGGSSDMAGSASGMGGSSSSMEGIFPGVTGISSMNADGSLTYKFEIHFPIGLNYCEDLLTWIQMFQHDELRIAYLPRAFYHYVQHTNSITHAYTRATFKARQQFQHLLEIHLPSEEYSYEKRKSQLSVVTEAFINGVLSHREAQRLVWKNKRAALLETHSIRWLIGYLSILLYCFPVAKRCLKY